MICVLLSPGKSLDPFEGGQKKLKGIRVLNPQPHMQILCSFYPISLSHCQLLDVIRSYFCRRIIIIIGGVIKYYIYYKDYIRIKGQFEVWTWIPNWPPEFTLFINFIPSFVFTVVGFMIQSETSFDSKGPFKSLWVSVFFSLFFWKTCYRRRINSGILYLQWVTLSSELIPPWRDTILVFSTYDLE